MTYMDSFRDETLDPGDLLQLQEHDRDAQGSSLNAVDEHDVSDIDQDGGVLGEAPQSSGGIHPHTRGHDEDHGRTKERDGRPYGGTTTSRVATLMSWKN